MNAYKGGYYIMSAFRENPVALEARRAVPCYIMISENILVSAAGSPGTYWLFGFGAPWSLLDPVPYLALPAITWDTYNRSGRGYIQGRFRGKNMVYEEAEFRFRISKDGLFGGVVFANFTTASNPFTGQKVFDAFAPGYGFGLRIMMNKKDRTNIAMDYGRGDGFSGVYFNIREAF